MHIKVAEFKKEKRNVTQHMSLLEIKMNYARFKLVVDWEQIVVDWEQKSICPLSGSEYNMSDITSLFWQQSPQQNDSGFKTDNPLKGHSLRNKSGRFLKSHEINGK